MASGHRFSGTASVEVHRDLVLVREEHLCGPSVPQGGLPFSASSPLMRRRSSADRGIGFHEALHQRLTTEREDKDGGGQQEFQNETLGIGAHGKGCFIHGM